MQNKIFSRANILIKKNELEKWATIACDQFTSDEDYWKEVENYIGSSPSTYNIVFPEIFLKKINLEEKKEKIDSFMKEYLEKDLFNEYKNSYIYVERTLLDGKIRRGIIGKIDLKAYDYNKNSKTPVRPTEGTIIDRLPPRVKIRENALLESPHILILINDMKQKIIENISSKKDSFKKLYDFNLMMAGGNIKGFLVDDETSLYFEKELEVLEKNSEDNLVFATGDGNHSLATAKKCYENLIEKYGQNFADDSEFRYALVEINNIHDKSLKFEPIHRAIFNIDKEHFLKNLKNFCENNSRASKFEPQYFYLVDENKKEKIKIKSPPHNLAVGSIQFFLDEYINKFSASIDYLHTFEEIEYIIKNKNGVGILLESINKEDLFKTVIIEGALPRKTFSMGESTEKRYYLECRKL